MKISFSNRKMVRYIILCAILLCGIGKSQTLDPRGFPTGKLNSSKSISPQNNAVDFYQKHSIQNQSSDVWEPTGPNGITANCIAVDPNNSNIIFAGGISGLYKTTNGGINWMLAGTETLNKYIIAVAVSPDSPNVVFCQTDNEFMKSTDGGDSWSYLLHKYSTFRDNQHTIYMNSARPGWVLMYSDSVYSSTDGGNTWYTNSTFGHITALSVYSQNQDIIYAVGDSLLQFMLIKSIDGGLHWTVAVRNIIGSLLNNSRYAKT